MGCKWLPALGLVFLLLSLLLLREQVAFSKGIVPQTGSSLFVFLIEVLSSGLC